MPNVLFRTKATDTTDYVVLKSSPVLRGRAREYSGYIQLRLLEVEQGVIPRMGSARAKGVVRVVCDPRPCYYGKGKTSEGADMLRKLVSLARLYGE